MYRAYYDASVKSRLPQEAAQVEQGREMLAQALEIGWGAVPLNIGAMLAQMPSNSVLPGPLLARVQTLLEDSAAEPDAPALRTRVLELGAALFQSIRMQLSVERYGAEAVSRGANLDKLDAPVNDTMWMRRKILDIRGLSELIAQVAAIRALLTQTIRWRFIPSCCEHGRQLSRNSTCRCRRRRTAN